MPPVSAKLFSEDAEYLPSTPPSGWVTAHCDGGARGNPGPAGYGAVLQDESGAILAELSEFLGNRTNNYAEYCGLLGCLQWSLDHGRRRLRVVSDSELMVKQIQGKYKVNSPDLRPLWEEARRRIAQLEQFQISHALRHKNKAADQLANAAMDRGTNRARTAGERLGAARESTGEIRQSAVRASPRRGSASGERDPAPEAASGSMLRGFTRDGTIHMLGDARLPDGVFVKIIPE